MKIEHFNDPFPYTVIDDLYDDYEKTIIWDELTFLCHPGKMEVPTNTGSALGGGQILKKNTALWIDDLYRDRKFSNILNSNRKIFRFHNEVTGSHPSWFFKNCEWTNDFTLVSYYENQDEYLPHRDGAYATCLTWFYREPKKFTGGDLTFVDYDIDIEIANNKAVIFPSVITHQVHPISMDVRDMGKQQGRFCISQFLHITE
tara:strand:+ start:19208 stop:19813 length:606 start_codon:yes stop_codon:yes gene_type:complete